MDGAMIPDCVQLPICLLCCACVTSTSGRGTMNQRRFLPPVVPTATGAGQMSMLKEYPSRYD
jgi:hypothetical protein